LGVSLSAMEEADLFRPRPVGIAPARATRHVLHRRRILYRLLTDYRNLAPVKLSQEKENLTRRLKRLHEKDDKIRDYWRTMEAISGYPLGMKTEAAVAEYRERVQEARKLEESGVPNEYLIPLTETGRPDPKYFASGRAQIGVSLPSETVEGREVRARLLLVEQIQQMRREEKRENIFKALDVCLVQLYRQWEAA